MNVTTTVRAVSCLILNRHFVSLPIVYSICYPLKAFEFDRRFVTTQSLKYDKIRWRNSCVGLKIPVCVRKIAVRVSTPPPLLSLSQTFSQSGFVLGFCGWCDVVVLDVGLIFPVAPLFPVVSRGDVSRVVTVFGFSTEDVFSVFFIPTNQHVGLVSVCSFLLRPLFHLNAHVVVPCINFV